MLFWFSSFLSLLKLSVTVPELLFAAVAVKHPRLWVRLMFSGTKVQTRIYLFVRWKRKGNCGRCGSWEYWGEVHVWFLLGPCERSTHHTPKLLWLVRSFIWLGGVAALFLSFILKSFLSAGLRSQDQDHHHAWIKSWRIFFVFLCSTSHFLDLTANWQKNTSNLTFSLVAESKPVSFHHFWSECSGCVLAWISLYAEGQRPAWKLWIVMWVIINTELILWGEQRSVSVPQRPSQEEVWCKIWFIDKDLPFACENYAHTQRISAVYDFVSRSNISNRFALISRLLWEQL